MKVQDLINDLQSIETVVEQGLATADAFAKGDPQIDAPVELAEAILPIVGDLVNKALTAWSNASGQPITIETVQALLPNATPLTSPPAQ